MKTGYKVIDAMTKNPIVVTPDISVTECAKMMDDSHVGGLVVKKGKTLVGIITEQDIVRKVVALGMDPKTTPVKKVMVKQVITVKSSDDIYDALVKMRDANVRHLPVVNGSEMVGLLTIKDILKIQPQLFDLVVDKFNLREEDDKPIGVLRSEGVCEICGEYARMLNNKEGLMLCDKCKAEQEIEEGEEE